MVQSYMTSRRIISVYVRRTKLEVIVSDSLLKIKQSLAACWKEHPQDVFDTCELETKQRGEAVLTRK